MKYSERVGQRDHDLPIHRNGVMVDLLVEGFDERDGARVVVGDTERDLPFFVIIQR
jgi:hypothetical protein